MVLVVLRHTKSQGVVSAITLEQLREHVLHYRRVNSFIWGVHQPTLIFPLWKRLSYDFSFAYKARANLFLV